MLSLLHLSKRDFRRGSCGKFLAFLLHDLQRRPRTSPCTLRLSRCSSALSCALIAPIAAVTCDLTRLPNPPSQPRACRQGRPGFVGIDSRRLETPPGVKWYGLGLGNPLISS